jgi:hypothetical protein
MQLLQSIEIKYCRSHSRIKIAAMNNPGSMYDFTARIKSGLLGLSYKSTQILNVDPIEPTQV